MSVKKDSKDLNELRNQLFDSTELYKLYSFFEVFIAATIGLDKDTGILTSAAFKKVFENDEALTELTRTRPGPYNILSFSNRQSKAMRRLQSYFTKVKAKNRLNYLPTKKYLETLKVIRTKVDLAFLLTSPSLSVRSFGEALVVLGQRPCPINSPYSIKGFKSRDGEIVEFDGVRYKLQQLPHLYDKSTLVDKKLKVK